MRIKDWSFYSPCKMEISIEYDPKLGHARMMIQTETTIDQDPIIEILWFASNAVFINTSGPQVQTLFVFKSTKWIT